MISIHPCHIRTKKLNEVSERGDYPLPRYARSALAPVAARPQLKVNRLCRFGAWRPTTAFSNMMQIPVNE